MAATGAGSARFLRNTRDVASCDATLCDAEARRLILAARHHAGASGANAMGKGDKQRSNREAKKPKADKKAVPAAAASKSTSDQGRAAGKTPSK